MIDAAGERATTRRALILFAALTFAMGWGLAAVAWTVPAAALWIAGWAPAIAAFSLAIHARQGRALFDRLFLPVDPGWLLLSLGFLPGIGLLVWALAPDFAPDWPVTPHAVLIGTPAVMFGTPIILTSAAPLGGEFGWRGYALPRLLSVTGPFRATGILAVASIAWSLPILLWAGALSADPARIAWWIAGMIALSWVMTWLHLRTAGNLIAAGVLPRFVLVSAIASGAWDWRPAEVIGLAVLAGIMALFPDPPAKAD